MKTWDCIKAYINKWQGMVGVDPFDTKEFITAVNKKSTRLDRLSNIKASQIGKGVIYVALLLEACSMNLNSHANVMGHRTDVPIGISNTKYLDSINTEEGIAEFVDEHIEVHPDADVVFNGFKELIIEVKDSTGSFRSGATSIAMANSNRLMRPLSLQIEQFMRRFDDASFHHEYWDELAHKHKTSSKRDLLFAKIKELEDVHLQIDVPSWGDNLLKYFLEDYKNYDYKRLNIIFDLLYAAREEEYKPLLGDIAAISIEADLIKHKLPTLAHTIIDKGVDELWLVRREGYVRVADLKNINDYVNVNSISGGRANATAKMFA